MSLLDKTNLLITPNAVKAGKLYSVIPNTPALDLTVVRNTTATRFNSSGVLVVEAANVARLNYLTSGGIPFILDESQSTNLFLNSQNFSNASWNKQNLTVASNNSASPSGLIDSSKLTSNSTGTTQIFIFFTANTNTTYSISFFAKKNTSNFIFLREFFSSGSQKISWFDLNNGTTGTKDSSHTLSMQPLINDYYKCTVTVTTNANSRNESIGIGLSDANGSQATTSNSSVFLYGAQLEINSNSSSYIPTLAAAVTRNADVITVAPPAGTVKITTTFSNNTTQVLTTIPATFTLPEGLIKQVLMQKTL